MTRYTWLLALLLMVPRAVAAQPTPNVVVEYYHLDAVGSVRVVTNASGAVVRTHAYEPFGHGDGVAAGSDPTRFTGQERDPETGLDYFGARYYGSRTGRFTTVDPVMNIDAALLEPQRWNRYAYALNRPLVMIDPDGREAGFIYLANGQMVAPIKGMTPTMATLWGGTVAAGGVALAGLGGAAAAEAAAFALLVRNSAAVFAA
jgi:RHS repeat-associated protein